MTKKKKKIEKIRDVTGDIAGRDIHKTEGGVAIEASDGGQVTLKGSNIAGRDQYIQNGFTAAEVTEMLLKLQHKEQRLSKPPLPYEPEIILIPAGPFIMGADDDPLAAPRHTVELPDYGIGRYPVTNEQFAEFIRQTNRIASRDLLWEGNYPPRDKLRHPVTGVTWLEALAYCKWLVDLTERPYSLPSEAHWEKAARGEDGRLFPWGNEWKDGRCHTDLESVAAVDAYPAQSPYGCYDMVGNGREWTTALWGDAPREPDEWYKYPWAADGRRDNLHAPATTRRVFRGGRGEGVAAYYCSKRGALLPDQSGPRRNRHGFRVVLHSANGRNE